MPDDFCVLEGFVVIEASATFGPPSPKGWRSRGPKRDLFHGHGKLVLMMLVCLRQDVDVLRDVPLRFWRAQ